MKHFVATPENSSALAAVRCVLACVGSRRLHREINPLFLHGPAGSGKSHLAAGLAAEVARQASELTVRLVPARDWATGDGQAGKPDLHSADVVILEDLQHLPARAADSLARIVDELAAHDRQMVFTANAGPGQLGQFPVRLTSRLAAGLVVGLEPLSAASRLAVLEDKARRRQIAVGLEVLAWLADHLPGGVRQLEGALARLQTLVRSSPSPPDVATVAKHFRDEAEARRPSLESIARQVGGWFRVEPRQLQSRRRSADVLLPRQVGMFLARRLTGLSLEEIGAWFGGRDHSTVLHACHKVEQALDRDAGLAGAVRQLHAELG